MAWRCLFFKSILICDMSSYIHISGVAKNASLESLSSTIKQVFLDSTDNLSWLKPGEIVLLKPAVNSPDSYPSTTHPLAVSVVAKVLKERGARVIVGDQSGIEHVVHGPQGVVKGSTKYCFERVGIKTDDAELVGFEEGGWNEGFDHFESPEAKAWSNGFYVTNWIRKADHIISLPRLSTHAQAGVTLGFKNMVGVLREDSRMTFHANGPFNAFITNAAKGAKIDVVRDGRTDFFEKIVEISLALREKLRLTLFVGTQAQTTFGPDRHVAPMADSYVATPEMGFVFASADQVAAEMVAIAFLTHLYVKGTPSSQKIAQKILMMVNGRAKELGTYTVAENPFITHAVKLGLGSTKFEAKYTNVPEGFQRALNGMIV